ncbi:MAG TPA: DUF1697 domain-containing protein [Acidimicrobiales bacterium]|nr:DUF1697 domain-containing protein [Acidimicrobiales bacterium]
MTTTYVALLRSVNVAGHGKIKMDELQRAFRGLGYTDVATYIQSGNVILTSDAPVLAVDLESAIKAELGMDVTVMLRTAARLARVVERNPFRHTDPSKLHVAFMAHRPHAAAVQKLDLERFSPEDVIIDGTESYLHLPNGVGRAKLPEYIGRQLKVPMTIRNWNTVTKLVELIGA